MRTGDKLTSEKSLRRNISVNLRQILSSLMYKKQQKFGNTRWFVEMPRLKSSRFPRHLKVSLYSLVWLSLKVATTKKEVTFYLFVLTFKKISKTKTLNKQFCVDKTKPNRRGVDYSSVYFNSSSNLFLIKDYNNNNYEKDHVF